MSRPLEKIFDHCRRVVLPWPGFAKSWFWKWSPSTAPPITV